MANGTNERFKKLIGCSVAGGIGFSPVFLGAAHGWSEILIRFLGLSLVALSTGMFTVIGSDLWKMYLRKKVVILRIRILRIKIFKRGKKEKGGSDGTNKTDTNSSGRVA
jgi:hypothetical protein